MKGRILFLVKIFIVLLLYFLVQKIIFIFSNAQSVNVSDILHVLWNGRGLDISTSGYLLILPFILVWISIWFPQIPIRKSITPYYIIISFLLSSICVVDTSLYSFWKFKLDATILNYLDAPKQALASISYGFIAWRVLLSAVYTLILSGILYRITPAKFQKLGITFKMIPYHFIYIIFGGLIFLGIRGGIGRSTMNIGNAYFSENNFLNHSAVNPAFSLFYSWNKAEDYADKYNYLNDEVLAKVHKGLYPKQTEDNHIRLLNTQRPNILIIILEGFGHSQLTAPDVAPRLNALIKESIYFENVYANSFRTDRGLVSALSGHISYPTTSIMKLPAKSGLLPGVAHSLQRHGGYHTEILYAGDIDFTNMRSYFTSTGYQKLISDKDFSLSERTSSSWGAHDEYGFARLYTMITSYPEGQPWHTTFLTLSSHEPFEVPYNRLENKRDNAFAYTDHCLGMFIDKIKGTPLWKDLLIICLPDHGSSAVLPMNSPLFYHIPMLWMGGAIKSPERIPTLMNQSDLAATLLSQLEIPHQDYPYSRNIFSENYTYPFAYSTFSDGFIFRDSTGITAFDNIAQKNLLSEPAPSTEREEKGKAILQYSYDELGGVQ